MWERLGRAYTRTCRQKIAQSIGLALMADSGYTGTNLRTYISLIPRFHPACMVMHVKEGEPGNEARHLYGCTSSFSLVLA